MSNKLGTKNLQTSSVSKTLLPGNSVCKINSINLEEFKFKQGAYQLILNLESSPITEQNFEGFFIDKEDESQGRYLGQVGRVRAHKYPYSDFVTTNGDQISRDQEIMKFVKRVCEATGCIKWFEEADDKFDTIEQFIEAFNTDAPFKDKYLAFCLNGKEYKNKAGYTNYDLFLPKFSKEGVAFEPVDAKISKLIKFDPKTGIEKRSDAQKVTGFDAEEANNSTISQDFSL